MGPRGDSPFPEVPRAQVTHRAQHPNMPWADRQGGTAPGPEPTVPLGRELRIGVRVGRARGNTELQAELLPKTGQFLGRRPALLSPRVVPGPLINDSFDSFVSN